MGTLFSALDISRTAMAAAQVQIDVAGHNIANVNKEGFSRQRVELGTLVPNVLSFGVLGRGVGIERIARIRDTFLDLSYRLQVPGLGRAEVAAQYYTRIEDIFLEPGENGFGSRLDLFFNALSEYAGNVEEMPMRESVLSEAEALAGSLNQVAERFNLLRTDANEEVKNDVEEINSLAQRIAFLNTQIRDVEAGQNQANDLRDDRDLLIDQLAKLVNITARERSQGGQVDILIGSDMLVDGSEWRELAAVRNPALDPERNDLVEVRFADNNDLVEVRDGELHAALDMRDNVLVNFDGRLDAMAAALIEKINSIHSQGNGLQNLTGTISSTNAVSDAAAALGSAGLPFTLTPGTFDVVVYDSAGTATTTTITITAATTLNDLAAALDGVANLSASVSGGNTLDITPDSGYSMTFANDSSGVLTALGINGLFTGHDAQSIAVSQHLLDNPALLTSGYSLDVLETGDNQAALDMADVRNLLLLDSGSSTINDYYENTIVSLGVDSQANNQILDVEQATVNDFQRRRQEVSGVSLDEEITFMIQYQRAYEAAARVVTVTDRMLDALLTMAL